MSSRHVRIMLLAALAAGPSTPAQDAAVRVASTLPNNGTNRYYNGNRAPLLASPLIKLPIGSVKPHGWLRKQLELMGEGFTGHLSEISEFCKLEGSAWVNPRGEGRNGWEELPYWLKGYYNLGYALQDRRILEESRKWLDGVLATQRPNGYFGSRANEEGGRISAPAAHGWPPSMQGKVPDLWPNMVMLYPLRSYYEATGDRRVLDFMLKYFRWQTTIPLEYFTPFSWQQYRAGDNLDVMLWLYNQTGEEWLLELVRVNHERTANWTGGIPTWHVVNIAQCFREPAQYYALSKDVRHLRATERDYDTVRSLFGQTPGGLYGADENARPGFDGPRQGTETCAMVEIIYSHSMIGGITGNGLWHDRAEDVAFNSLPCSMTPDLKGLHYLTAPNQIQLDKGNKSPSVQNAGDMFSYNPYQYRCCQHNVAFGWPYYSEYLWMATPGDGLAAVYYAAGEVTAKVGDGAKVTIRQTTDYPFEETVKLQLTAEKSVRFPLTLRVPGWSGRPKITVNGRAVTLPAEAKGWVILDRTWASGDTVQVEFPAPISTTTWEKNRNTISVHRGPLTYSLKIGERWQRAGGADKWPGQEVYPTTPWNYGLVLDAQNPAGSFAVEKRGGPLAAQPFTPDAAPIQLKAKAKHIAEWKQEPNGMVGEVQMSPARSDAPVEEVTLIPMGAARLRIASFPQIGEGPGAVRWKENLPVILASNASHFAPPTPIADGVVPRHSGDRETPRFSFPPSGFAFSLGRNLLEWVEYRYPRPKKMSRSSVYWAEDEDPRPECRVPTAWRLEWWDGKSWKPVEAAGPYGVRKSVENQVEFQPVESDRIRLRIETDERATAGIYEWRVQ